MSSTTFSPRHRQSSLGTEDSFELIESNDFRLDESTSRSRSSISTLGRDTNFSKSIFSSMCIADAVYEDGASAEQVLTSLPKDHRVTSCVIASETSWNWGVFNRLDGVTTVAFAGTDSLNDVLVDASFIPVDFFGGRVHRGFYQRAMEIPLIPIIDLLDQKRPVNLVGHSLGGSIAVIVLLRLFEERPSLVQQYVQCHTFGMPQVGDTNFSKNIARNNLTGLFHHFVNSGDLVPRLSNYHDQFRSKLVDWLRGTGSTEAKETTTTKDENSKEKSEGEENQQEEEKANKVDEKELELLDETPSGGGSAFHFLADFADTTMMMFHPMGVYYMLSPQSIQLLSLSQVQSWVQSPIGKKKAAVDEHRMKTYLERFLLHHQWCFNLQKILDTSIYGFTFVLKDNQWQADDDEDDDADADAHEGISDIHPTVATINLAPVVNEVTVRSTGISMQVSVKGDNLGFMQQVEVQDFTESFKIANFTLQTAKVDTNPIHHTSTVSFLINDSISNMKLHTGSVLTLYSPFGNVNHELESGVVKGFSILTDSSSAVAKLTLNEMVEIAFARSLIFGTRDAESGVSRLLLDNLMSLQTILLAESTSKKDDAGSLATVYADYFHNSVKLFAAVEQSRDIIAAMDIFGPQSSSTFAGAIGDLMKSFRDGPTASFTSYTEYLVYLTKTKLQLNLDYVPRIDFFMEELATETLNTHETLSESGHAKFVRSCFTLRTGLMKNFVLGVAGVSGSGKSTLLHKLFGSSLPDVEPSNVLRSDIHNVHFVDDLEELAVIEFPGPNHPSFLGLEIDTTTQSTSSSSSSTTTSTSDIKGSGRFAEERKRDALPVLPMPYFACSILIVVLELGHVHAEQVSLMRTIFREAKNVPILVIFNKAELLINTFTSKQEFDVLFAHHCTSIGISPQHAMICSFLENTPEMSNVGIHSIPTVKRWLFSQMISSGLDWNSNSANGPTQTQTSSSSSSGGTPKM
eukprot:TRINITY_DN1831_c0_g1_i1.p1 TRINITY_DN1831_c0_g1~~TRINITY_DN1831_c0_g1_i1.p1  ORF type:complete len:978 (-),score=317.97 TRINITY_DN1831_c0_g1_i1:654-3566(-)